MEPIFEKKKKTFFGLIIPGRNGNKTCLRLPTSDPFLQTVGIIRNLSPFCRSNCTKKDEGAK